MGLGAHGPCPRSSKGLLILPGGRSPRPSLPPQPLDGGARGRQGLPPPGNPGNPGNMLRVAQVRARCRRLSWVGGLRVFGPESQTHPPGSFSERRVPEESREDQSRPRLPRQRPHSAPSLFSAGLPFHAVGRCCCVQLRVPSPFKGDVRRRPHCPRLLRPRPSTWGDWLPREPRAPPGT